MKAANGGTVPDTFGCTFCHSNPLNNKMKDALSHFDNTKVSKHPVGYNYLTQTDSNNEYLSSVASAPISGEIRCIDCHDPTILTYPDHQTVGNGGTWDQTNNPFALRNVSAPKAYDDLCRACHGNPPTGTWGNPQVPVSSHDDGTAATGSGAIVENDGTPLQTTTATNVTNKTQCSTCHDSHYSTKRRLLGDGHEGDTVIDEANCTAVCHYPGDQNNSYLNHGHGKPTATLTGGTLGLDCTACHDANADHSGTSVDYKTRNRLVFSLQSGETASSFGTPTYSICYICHGGYQAHMGSKNAGGSFTAGCLDCHDEHAEGSGVGSNIFMIPEVSKPNGNFGTIDIVKPATESVLYTTQLDYYRSDGAGVCDNTECHVGIGPLSGIMGVGGTHPGGPQNPGDNCKACHKHGKSDTPPYNIDEDPAGGWRATASCSDCHGYPPNTNAHLKHVNTAGFDCGVCHPKPGDGSTVHNESGVVDGADYESRNIADIRQNVDVVFDSTLNPNGTYSQPKGSRSGLGDGTCSNLYCHGDDTTRFPAADQGTNTTPAWNNTGPGGDGDCGTCHKVTAANPPGTFAHPTHAGSTGYGFGCNLCHVNTTTDGTTVQYPAHVNGQADVAFDTSDPRLDSNSKYNGTATVGDAATDTNDTCSNTYCHSPGNDTSAPFSQAPAQALQWDGTANCWSCHGDGSTTPMPSYTDNTVIDGSPKGNKHPKHVTANGYSCSTCHSQTTTDGATIANKTVHVNMSYEVAPDSNNTATLDDFTYSTGTCSSTNCHGGNTVAWNYDVSANGHFTCDVCHSQEGGSTLGVSDVNNWSFGDWVQSKIDNDNEFPNAGHGAKGKVCADCHDSNVDHDTSSNLSGANPFRLVDQDTGTAGVQFTCANTSIGCHSNSPAKDVVTHSKTEMENAGYATQVNTWHISPECVNCHDPHGDQASGASSENLYMIQREIYDKAAFTLPAGPPPAEPTEQTNLEFTDASTGASTAGNSFADLDSPASSLCQECHETTDPDMTSFLDDTAPGVVTSPHPNAPDTNPGTCTACHKHNEAFKPSGCNACHTYPGLDVLTGTHVLSGAHDTHVGAPGAGGAVNKGFSCDKCHPTPGGANHNQSGVTGPSDWSTKFDPANVQIQFDSWNPANANGPTYAGQAADAAGGNVASGVGGTGTCAGLYCHGDNASTQVGWGGSNTTPAWNGTISCGDCHDATTADTTPSTRISTGNHTAHLSATYGPGLGDGCSTCHTGATINDSTHVNTVKNFVTSSADATPTTLGTDYTTGTQVCNNCHSTATVNGAVGATLAKQNFSNGSYKLPCLNCHNGTDPATNNVDGTGRLAPDMLGDDANYGAEVRGHNRPSAAGTYPVSGNAAAARACTDCHDSSTTHINNTDDTTYAGNRLLSTINGQTGITTVTALCEACHRTTGTSPASKKNINTHSNLDYANKLEGATFTTDCAQCHEPHGMVFNGTGYNIYMINPTITITAGVTQTGVRFEAVTGNYSFNDTQNTPSDDLCAVCHTNTNNPGYPMTYNSDGQHAAPAYNKDERGNNCGACHIHNQDSDITTQDGLMPLACNGCHTYPGLPTNTGTHRLSATHDVHVGVPSDETPVSNKGFSCSRCHNGSDHNTAGITGPSEWNLVNVNTDVQVRFDSFNPNAQANNPADTTLDSTSYDDTNNVCSNLYCHGADFATPSGNNTTPDWDVSTDGDCGQCHDTGLNDVTTTTSISTGNHTAHLTAAYGPGFGTEGCTNCHTGYDLSSSGTHVDGSVEFANVDTSVASYSVLGTTAPSGSPDSTSTDRCNSCHSTATVNGAVGTVQAKTNWSNSSYKLDCLYCHNGTDPATSNADGTGNVAPDIYATWSLNGHGSSSIDNASTTTDSGTVDQVPPVRCETCHDITTNHLPPATNNPWRLLAATNYSTAGGLDAFCATQCHLTTAPADHTYNVAQSEAKEGSDTHPVATQVVPDSRWFQVPPDADMPLDGDLTTFGNTNAATDNIACVSCHDPHGVGSTVVTGRTFSGVNTESTDAQMTRFNYSGSGTGSTPLCVKCHK